MQVIVSLLVLALSMLSLSPIFLAYRVPSRKDQAEPRILTANNDLSTSYSSDDQDLSSTNRQIISYLNSLMSEQKLYGSWQDLSFGSDVENQGGFSTLRYVNGYESYDDSIDIMLCLYNGLYTTNTNYSCTTVSEFIPFIQDKSLDTENMVLTLKDITVQLSEGGTNSINDLGKECTASISLNFLDKMSGGAFVPSYDEEVDKKAFAVQFQVESDDCSFKFTTSAMNSEDNLIQSQSTVYSIAMTIAAFIQSVLCFVLNRVFQRNKALCQQVSQGTLRAIHTFDFYIALASLIQFTTNPSVGFVAIPYGILCLYFEAQLIRTISQAQGNLLERGYSSLNFTNLICLVASLVIAVIAAFFQKPELIFFLFCLHMVPQIYQNYVFQRKYRPQQYVIFAFIVPKILYIAYVLGSPKNLFKYSTDIELLSLLGNLLMNQGVLLLVQGYYPVFCLKRKSIYKFLKVSTNKDKEEVCCICLENLEGNSPLKDHSPSKCQAKQEKMMILTPCKHQFHECCLRDWTELKSACPYCRYCLPPLPEEDE